MTKVIHLQQAALQVTVAVGSLMGAFIRAQTSASHRPIPAPTAEVQRVFFSLLHACNCAGISLFKSICYKTKINATRYPTRLDNELGGRLRNETKLHIPFCVSIKSETKFKPVRQGEFFDFSFDIVVDSSNGNNDEQAFLSRLPELISIGNAFAKERGWLSHDSDTSLLLSMSAESGELAEVFQHSPPMGIADIAEIHHFATEIADVAIYLLRFCERRGISEQIHRSCGKGGPNSLSMID